MSRLAIVAMGACTSEGYSPRQIVTSARVRSVESRRSTLGDAETGTLRLGLCNHLADDVVGYERLRRLAVHALAQACTHRYDAPIPLLLALPAPSPEESAATPSTGTTQAALGTGSDLLAALATDARFGIDPRRSRAFEHGHAAGAAAVAHAARLLTGPSPPAAVMIAGVDGCYESRRIARWRERGTVFGAGPEGCVTPAEAAAVVVVEPAARSARPSIAMIEGVEVSGFGEGALPEAEGRSTAELVRELFGRGEVGWFLSDLYPDPERRKDWSEVSRALAELDPRDAILGRVQDDAMASHVGDVGAASALLFTIMAASSFRLGCAPASRALVAVRSDGPERGALLVCDERAAEPEMQPRPPRPNVVPGPHVGPALALRRALARVWRSLDEASPRWSYARRAEMARRWTAIDTGLDAVLSSHRSTEDLLASFDNLVARLAQLQTDLEGQRRHDRGRRLQVVLAAVRTLEAGTASLRSLRDAVVDWLVRVEAEGGPGESELSPDAPSTVSLGVPLLYDWGYADQAIALALRSMASTEDDDMEDAAAVLARDPLDELEEEEDTAEPGEDAAEESTTDEEREVAPDDRLEGPTIEGAKATIEAELARRARESFEAIGRLRRLRRAEEEEPWTPALQRFDQRILSHLDFLQSLAEPRLSSSSETAPVPERFDVLSALDDYAPPGSASGDRGFVRTLLIGCSCRPELMGASTYGVLGARAWVRDGHADALALASNPAIEDALEDLAVDRVPAIVRIATRTFGARRTTRLGSVAPLLTHPDPSVRREAASALAVAPAREAAVAVLEERVEQELDAAVQLGLVESLVRLRAPYAVDLLRQRVLEETGPLRWRYAELLALIGHAKDEELLSSCATTPEGILVLGWFGRTTVVDALIQQLEALPAGGITTLGRRPARPDKRTASAFALQRIFGVVATGSARDPRLEPLEMATSQWHQLVYDGARWRAYWSKRAREIGASAKLRFGQSYTAKASLAELMAEGVLQSERRIAGLEFELSSPPAAGLLADRRDWVAHQVMVAERALRAT